ncbi:helix-turn-helix transcriptional regulator [Nonomuraea sp. MG754425]|uniref:AraC family transcriptional regulator n=1 Tax=Nonomuraea sp. MG754425 TaxID=2570319 RepID=UPI001F2A0AC3|nr:AraC family transcriptional regulator [Nonomuraea sp. MG754425]MCF6471801.1 helix-turn-helix transcriptional regulator [Nonomuraea sp. MG754425]
MYALAALVDLDDFVASERARGRSWASAQLDRVERAVRVTAGERASSRPLPPDEWLVLLTGEEPRLLAAEAGLLAERLRERIERESELTATVSLGPPCGSRAAAEREARRTNSYKLVLGGDRVIAAPAGGPAGPGVPPVRIEAALASRVRAGDRVGAADLISAWLDRCARLPGADPQQLRSRLIGQLLFVVDVAATNRLADGRTDWVDACARLPIDDLIAVADIHERSYLRLWLQDALRRLVPAPPERGVLALAERYMAEHFDDPGLRLATVAEAISASPFYISHLFAQERRSTFLRHLTGLRLRHARHLLHTSTLPIDAVAARCGYLSAKALRGVFKRHVGCTPTAYRRAGG